MRPRPLILLPPRLVKRGLPKSIQWTYVIPMPKKPQRPPQKTDPAQHKRFLDMAREVEVDERPEAFDRAFRKVVKPPKKPPER